MTGRVSRPDSRSPLARAIGLGSAKSGVAHWWALRVSSVALIPLTLWFVASIIAHAGDDHAAFLAWLKSPVSSAAMVLLLVATFHHAALGLQVVIEDYLHGGEKFAALILLRLVAIGLAAVGILATLRIALSG
jgi:succinate dehydrogenase / fumarate reductase membrane anchor subunit